MKKWKLIMFKKYFIFVIVINFLISCSDKEIKSSDQEIKFGVITDVHFGFLTDVHKRLKLFIDTAIAEDVEEIIDNIPYVEIPTASHKWVSANERAEPYTTARFAFVTINKTNGTIVIDGRSEDVEYQQGLPTHEGTITDKSYKF